MLSRLARRSVRVGGCSLTVPSLTKESCTVANSRSMGCHGCSTRQVCRVEFPASPSKQSPEPLATRQWFRALAVLALALLFAAPRAFAESVEQVAAKAKTTGYVTDLAGVLSQPTRDQLTTLCTEVAQKTQAEITVITIKSLDGRPLEEYSHDLAERLGLGPKGQGRGVLLLFAVNDRRYRTEVYYGLEAILPDGKTGGFGREAAPYLRCGQRRYLDRRGQCTVRG